MYDTIEPHTVGRGGGIWEQPSFMGAPNNEGYIPKTLALSQTLTGI